MLHFSKTRRIVLFYVCMHLLQKNLFWQLRILTESKLKKNVCCNSSRLSILAPNQQNKQQKEKFGQLTALYNIKWFFCKKWWSIFIFKSKSKWIMQRTKTFFEIFKCYMKQQKIRAEKENVDDNRFVCNVQHFKML